MFRRALSVGGSLAVLLLCAAGAQPADGADAAPLGKLAGLSFGTTEATLAGPDARHQLIVDGQFENGQVRDLTHAVRYSATPAGVVSVDATGFVVPLSDGQASVRAEADGGLSAQITCTVSGFNRVPPISFANDVVPIFTKRGCNAGVCHGKASGQNGFRLSLLGFYPQDDYDFLVKEDRGRRLSPAAPERSLLLLKSTGTVPHGGGQRIAPGDDQYRLIARWVAQGMPESRAGEPQVTRVEVVPRRKIMSRSDRQQLAVRAHYSDGTLRDVTRRAQFETNRTEMAEASVTGLVATFDLAGDVAVMVRYQSQVDVFEASVPLGAKLAKLPPAVNFIDELVLAKLSRLGVPPSDLCDDATFIRRSALDIAGRLPTADEARAFLADTSPQKRAAWIDRLLAGPEYADYFAAKWSSVLRNKRENERFARGTFAFHEWIRQSIYENKPYDEFVREIVTASGDIADSPPVVWYRSAKTANDQLEDVAQLFLGQRIQCARCHHHPFEKWSQTDYYGFAAFFSRVGRKQGHELAQEEERIYHMRGEPRSTNPRDGKSLRPTGLGAAPLAVAVDDDPRQKLADWMTDPSNPFFARALVNRYWKHFFGRGLVEPEDDMRVTNPPTNPELLDALAKSFTDSRYNLAELVRTICLSRTYQLSAVPDEFNAKDKQNFSRYYPKRLSAEVLYDALNRATDTTAGFNNMPRGTRALELPDNGFDNYFLSVFGKPQNESVCECERTGEVSLAQSLHLLNSREIQSKLTDGEGRAAQLARDEKRSPDQKVRELYLWVYSRAPTESELGFALAHLNDPRFKERPQQAYEDLLWALVNTKEFLFNH